MLRDTLADIEVWLSNNAPFTAANLHPSATEHAIRAAENVLGLAFSDDLRSLYRWHDGSPHKPAEGFQLFPGWFFLSLAEGIEKWRWRNELYAADLDESGSSRFWNKSWMPIGGEFTGGLLVIDISPTSPSFGKVFESDLENGPMFHQAWPSLSAALEDVVDTLAAEDPEPLRWLKPVVIAGNLEWQ